MEADRFSGSCPHKFQRDKNFGSYRTRVSTNFLLKKSHFLCRSIVWSACAKRLLYCNVSAAMFTKKLRFASYRTIVLGSEQPSLEKVAPLVFHSTNLTTDGSRLFSGSCLQKVSPGHQFSVAIERESPTTFV